MSVFVCERVFAVSDSERMIKRMMASSSSLVREAMARGGKDRRADALFDDLGPDRLRFCYPQPSKNGLLYSILKTRSSQYLSLPSAGELAEYKTTGVCPPTARASL